MLILKTRWPFPEVFHQTIQRVLEDEDDLQWDLATDPGRAAGGQAYQLRPAAKSSSLRFSMLAASVKARVIEAFSASSGVEESTLHDLTAQMFPVRMIGNEGSPPFQSPHWDNHTFEDGRRLRPDYTFVYYVAVTDCEGGELVLLDDSGQETHRHHPREGELVGIPGAQLHAVSQLTRGQRLSLVLNLYKVDMLLATSK